jgi:hypothetical protein
MRISAATARRLGWYIYAYVNPIDDRVFYVGKGHGRRVLHHLRDQNGGPKTSMIRTIRKAGLEPKLEILAHNLRDADTALRMEAAVIDALGLKALSNRVRGWHAVQSGRVPLAELVALYEKRRVQIKEPAIVIRITGLYRPDMTPAELYDATRGVWKVGRQRSKVLLAFAVFEGVVREVYDIAGWLKAGSTFTSRDPQGVRRRDRWEFVGRVASEKVRRRYVGRYVGHLFKRGAQNPVSYVNLGKGAV